MDNMVIVPMEEQHLDEVVAIENHCFSTPWSRLAFQECLAHERVFKCFVLLANGKVAGYMCSTYLYEEGELLNIAVAPDCRKQGFGGMMLDFLIKYMDDRLVERLLLEVRPSNESARSLYLSKGFSPIGIRKNYYKLPTEDGIVMEKKL